MNPDDATGGANSYPYNGHVNFVLLADLAWWWLYWQWNAWTN